MPTELHAAFPDGTTAEKALERLIAAGIEPNEVALTARSTEREASFLTRLVITIALWSIIGAITGVGLGIVTWIILGPEGTTGFIIQAVVWGIFGHLIAGMWAGYILLADRTDLDLPHDRATQLTVIEIHTSDEATSGIVRQIIASSGGKLQSRPRPHP